MTWAEKLLEATYEMYATIRRIEAEKTALRREVKTAKAGEDLVLDTLAIRDKEIVALQAIIDLLPAEFLLQVIEHFECTGFHTTARILQEFATAVARQKKGA